MGLGKGALVTCSCSSLTDVEMCPFKPQVVTVEVGQNVGVFCRVKHQLQVFRISFAKTT